MLSSRPTATAVLTAALALLATAPGAQAASPAAVTVRVEGASETKLAATAVTTTTAPVVKDGNLEHACPGTSAAGALELATSGSWSGTWFSGLGYSVEAVLGESHVFGSGSFWEEWLGGREGTGLCKDEPQSGEQLLLFPCPESGECPMPLAIEAPPSAGTGEAVSVTVRKHRPNGEALPVAGATVLGAASAVGTDGAGHATLTFAQAGTFTLRASAPETVRDEATISVHGAGSCACGTSTSTTSTSTPASPGGSALHSLEPTSYHGPFAVVARPLGLTDGHIYGRGHAPRIIAGAVTAHTAVASVSISLRRRHGGRCFAYSGARERFVRARCGSAPFFAVSTSPSFSYLLPAPLAPGRYVLDMEASDAAGNHTTLARGTSRIVFYVA